MGKEMNQTRVVNKKSGEAYDVYIGRGSKWGNPFTHLKGKTQAQFQVATRDESVESYRAWVLTQPELMADLHELRGKTLACFCKPARCHGDILAELADAQTAASAGPTGDVTGFAGKSVLRIALTGHRPNKLGGYDLSTPAYRRLQTDLETYIENALKRADVVIGHSGLALGADTVWAEAILAMRTKYPTRVFFHAEIPMLEQSEAWFKKSDIQAWERFVASADEQTVYGSLAGLDKTSDARKKKASQLLNLRNDGMIDHADELLGLYDGHSRGGTANALAYAKKVGKKTFIVAPSVYFG